MRKILLSLAFLLGLASVASAQQTIQQVPQDLTAAQWAVVGTNFNTVNTQSTATITPPAGLFVYITAMYLTACQDATGVASANTSFTTTGLGSGATAAPQFAYGAPLTVDSCISQPGLINFAKPLKSANAGTNVTVVSPSAATHTGFGIVVFGYFAP